MSETLQPSMTGKFLRGAMSGLFSGALMMGIVAAVAAVTPLSWMGLGAAASMVLCTSLFGGVMSVMRSGGEGRSASTEVTTAEVATPVIAQSMGRAPSVSADIAAEVATAPTRADGKSWVETAGKQAGRTSSIDSILADGALSDSDRASAILAARNHADASTPSL